MKLTNSAILFIIMVLAAVLRFYNYSEIPFTHDEFSALFRTNFSTFSDLIEKGVKVDGHPAGIQVFLYFWTKLFGQPEWIVKLPFSIFGLFSVYLIYKIGTKWFNQSVGLISAAFIASIQFTVMYSQIARPYISGLFFSLLMVWYWSKIILEPKKRFNKNYFWFIVSASLCTYNHYFSLLFAVIVGISGLFFISRQYLFNYLISGILILILFLPHLSIFMYQLNLGGVGGWLGKPNNDFLIKFISYIFNFSFLSLILVVGLILLGLYKNGRENFNFKKIILFGCWFLIPIITGFYYSRYVNPVLQYSVLIFSFPFLYFVLFGHIKLQKPLTSLIIVSIILGVNIFSLIVERQHYSLFYNSKGFLSHFQQVNINNKNVLSILDAHPKNTRYFLSKHHIDSNFIWLSTFSNENEFKVFIEAKSKVFNKLFLGSSSGINPNYIPIIQEYYPTILEQKNYVGATSFLFSKDVSKKNNLIEMVNFESKYYKNWSSIDTSKYNDSISNSATNSYLFDQTTEWGPVFTQRLDKLIKNKNNFIDISLMAKTNDSFDEAIFVGTLESNGKTIYWNGTFFNKYIIDTIKNNDWVTIHHSIKFSDIYLNYSNIMLKVYVHNPGKKSFFIDDFKIKFREGNPKIYGLTEKF